MAICFLGNPQSLVWTKTRVEMERQGTRNLAIKLSRNRLDVHLLPFMTPATPLGEREYSDTFLGLMVCAVNFWSTSCPAPKSVKLCEHEIIHATGNHQQPRARSSCLRSPRKRRSDYCADIDKPYLQKKSRKAERQSNTRYKSQPQQLDFLRYL